FELPRILQHLANPLPLDPKCVPEIRLENVCFTYPGTQKPVLKDVSLTIRSGQKLGIVGLNGAGKTTLIKLICRVFDPTSGRILINGIDLKQLSIEEWHSMLGVLFQDYICFEFLVRQGVRMGRPGLDYDEDLKGVHQACAAADATSFI